MVDSYILSLVDYALGAGLIEKEDYVYCVRSEERRVGKEC